MYMRLLLIVGVLAALITGLFPRVAQAQTAAPLYVPSARTQAKVRVIITLKNRYGYENERMNMRQIADRRASIVRDVENFSVTYKGILGTVHRTLTVFPVIVATVASTDLAVLARSAAVESISEDKLSKADMAESTDQINSRAANEGGYGGSGRTVAVLDTGVNKNHEFLSGQVIAEACFSTTDANDNATSLCPNGTSYETGPGKAAPCATLCDHGTHVAGTIAGKRITAGQVMMSGVAPDAKLIAVQVFSRFTDTATRKPCQNSNSASPCVLAYDSDQIAALQWLIAYRNSPGWQQLVSINMSLGGGKYNSACDVSEGSKATAITQLRNFGIATVIASGNSGFNNGIAAPACISAAIGVGSVLTRTASNNAPPDTFDMTRPDLISVFTNFPTNAANGANANGDRLLDLLAPGTAIYSSVATGVNQYQSYNGTSMATPHVAGAWAVIRGVTNASVSQVLTWLRNTGVAVTHSNGAVVPRIDVGAAVKAAKNNNAITELSSYALNFGRITRNQTTYMSVGVQTLLDIHQSLAMSISGGAYSIDSTTCLDYLDTHRPTCSVTVAFAPTAAQARYLYTGMLTITVAGVPYNVGLAGRSEPTTPDVGQTRTIVALSRTATRTRTPLPTIAAPVLTVMIAATQTRISLDVNRTFVALGATQYVLNDRASATAERQQGAPSRTRTSTTTMTPSPTPMAIVQTVSSAQTKTRVAQINLTSTQKSALTATAEAISNDKKTATAEPVTRTKTASPTRTATRTRTNTGTATATDLPTATATPLTLYEAHHDTASSSIAKLIAIRETEQYALLQQGTSSIPPALILNDTSLLSPQTQLLSGEKATAMTDVVGRAGVFVIGGRLYKNASYLQIYDIGPRGTIAQGLLLVPGDGEFTALYAENNMLYAALRYIPIGGGSERFEIRSYDITNPQVIEPIPSMVATVTGPVNSLAGVPLSTVLIAAGKKTGGTTGYMTVLNPVPGQLRLASTVSWPREIRSVAVRSIVDAGTPSHTVFATDGQDVVSLKLTTGTWALAAAPLAKLSQNADFIALDPTQSQLIAGYYDASAISIMTTNVTVYDILTPAKLWLRGKTVAVQGDGAVRGLSAEFGQLAIVAGSHVTILGAPGLLMPTMNPTETLTPSTTLTPSRTTTNTPTRTATATMTLTATMLPNINRIDAGEAHTCAMDYNDTVKCWGDAYYGQLGNNSITPQALPVAVSTRNLSRVRQIDSGWNHTCALNSDKSVACWGSNAYGELANLAKTNLLEPALSNVVSDTIQIAVGWQHNCAVTTDRLVFCWGFGATGQLGDAQSTDSITPALVLGISNVRQVALGSMHSCAVTLNNDLYCWGDNSAGQFGNNSTISHNTATIIATGISKVAVADDTTCILDTSKYVWCTGKNSYGQAGTVPGSINYSTNYTNIQTIVAGVTKPLANVVDIKAGRQHFCALDSSGVMSCWGSNSYNKLGLTSTNWYSHKAISVSGLSGSGAPKVIDMAVGGEHSCALLSTGVIKCWGQNNYGQLGDGTTLDRISPVTVTGLSAMVASPTPTRTP